MACRTCRNRAAEWGGLRKEFNGLDPEKDGPAREKIKARVLKEMDKVSNCCGPAEARRLAASIWPDITG